MSIKKCSFYLQNVDLLVCLDCKPLLQIFTEQTNNENCNTWELKAAAIPRHIKAQHIKGMANTLADSVSRLRAVGLYHNLNFMDCQHEFSSPFEPLPPVDHATHTPTHINEFFIEPNIEK